jgi:ParB/RepB/Spo0J family partition protein
MPMTDYAADSGTAIDSTVSPFLPEPDAPIHDQDISEIFAIELGDIVPSPFNPRRTFSEAAMAEMVESVKRVGVLQAVLVRPLHRTNMHDRPVYELVFGHRRWLAAQQAEQATLPAMIRELNDSQVAQQQAVENLQREDLSALDEAQGYAAYIKAHGISKDDLAARIGKSRTHVYQRLQLAKLVPEVTQALQNGRIRAEIATRIARIPPKQQVKALAVALERDPESGRQHSYRRATNELIEKFSLNLGDAIFDIGDAVLVDLAGACTTCPKRSGMTPELYADVVESENGAPYGYHRKGNANVCMDPDCFADKKKVHLRLRAQELAAKGATVVQGSAARAAIDANGKVKGAYVPLADVKGELARIAKENKVKAGTSAAQDVVPTIVTIQDPRNGNTVLAVKVSELQGAGVKVEPKKAKTAQHDYVAEQKKNAALATEKTAVNMALLAQVRQAAANTVRSAFDLQLIARTTWEGVEYLHRRVIANLHGFETEGALGDRIGQMSADQLGLLCLDCALVEEVKVDGYRLKAEPTNLLQAAAHYGIELPAQYQAKAAKTKGNGKPEEALAAEDGDDDGDDE